MQLLEHFNELSLHPKNAKELKGLILQLAVQGKLTNNWREEHPDVEPASELMKRIEKEKEKLISEKKIKKEKPLPAITEDEIPYELPEGWVWCRLGQAGYTQTGNTPPKNNQSYFGDFIPFIGPAHISNNWMEYPILGLSKSGIEVGRLIPKESLMMVCIGGSIGKCNITEIDVCCNQQINTITPIINIPDILRILCQSPYFQNEVWQKSSGSATPIINKGKWENIPISLPPLEEQKAIVEVVNQLFAEVEQLETLTKERISLKEDFATSALRQLSTGDTSTEWAFLKEHFSTFFTEKANIKKLRESILQLAVQGKLTANWRALRHSKGEPVEPASELLKRIQKEKEQLIKEKKIKKEKPLPKISDDEIPYELPEGWVWCRVGDFSLNLDGNRIPLSKTERAKRQGEFDYYGAQGVIDHIDDYLFDKPLLLIAEDGGNLLRRTKPVAYMAFGKYWVNNHAHVVDSIYPISNLYIEIYINSTNLEPYLNGQPPMQIKLNRGKLNLIPTTIPPLEEQQAIVEKVNSLMALCDALEAEIKTSKTMQELWMESSLREVFEG